MYSMANEYKYDRVLLKLSGEALAGDQGYGIDPRVVDDLAEEIAEIVHDGVQLAWIAPRPTTSACWPPS